MEKASHILTQILFGGTLADKLAGKDLAISEIEWDAPKIEMPEQPGRDGVLKPRTAQERDEGEEKTAFPKRSELKNESARGKLLHFFANHELLAIETMAYTLLRFPDAPVEFKKGVMKTIQDEQRHMGMYLDRMHEYGIDLGGVPLNLYFWNILKTMRSPLDFVTRMSLTFEQANLDFALEYAKLFEEEIADEKTAKLLRVVHDDEVKHVAHGLKWFNEWRNHDLSEFDAYSQLLPFPLTPRRAKGARFFSAPSRKEAGFSDEYILSMKVAGGSRGKVPDYFYFNPQCEMETQAGSLIELKDTLKNKIADLAPLMIWLTQEDDVVELARTPDLRWMNQVAGLRGPMPEFVVGPEVTKKYAAFEELKPWGWSESSFKRLQQLGPRMRKLPQITSSDSAFLFSKAEWKKALKNRQVQVLGDVIESPEQWKAWQRKVQAAPSAGSYLLKSSVSSTGRGHIVYTTAMLSDKALTSKIEARISQEGSVVIEPLLNRSFDFSTQYEIFLSTKTGELEIKPYPSRFFLTDSRFQFAGTLLGNWSQHPEYSAASKLLAENEKKIRGDHEKVFQILKEKNYTGPVGIDSLIYASEGKLEIASIIEVNARYTMGRIAIEIEKVLERKIGRKPALWNFVDKARQSPNDFNRMYGDEWLETSPYSQAQSTWSAVTWGTKISEKLFGDF